MRSRIVLGVDLDNTLICYDALFHALATERGFVPDSTPRSKRAVRDAMRARGQGDEWTEIQGLAYGDRLLAAPPFPGAASALRQLRARGVPFYIVSHKTRFAARGPSFDLRSAALEWLRYHNIAGEDQTCVPRESVYFEDSQSAKLSRIKKLGCTHFVDDLLELLLHPEFPSRTQRIHFDPGNENAPAPELSVMTHWSRLRECLRTSARRNDSHDAVYRSV